MFVSICDAHCTCFHLFAILNVFSILKLSMDNKSERGSLNKVVVAIIVVSIIVAAVLLVTLPKKDKNDQALSAKKAEELADKLGEPTAPDKSATNAEGEVKGTQDSLVNPTEGVDAGTLAELEKVNADTQAEEAPEVQAPSDADQAKKRDEQRFKDIEAIRVKLEAYKKEKGNYPEKLDGLKGLPKDPSFTDERGYTYTPIGKLPPLYYDLSFVTESDKMTFNTVELERGYHVSTPDASPMY